MSFAKPTGHTTLSFLENDRSGDLAALVFAIILAFIVAALLPM